MRFNIFSRSGKASKQPSIKELRNRIDTLYIENRQLKEQLQESQHEKIELLERLEESMEAELKLRKDIGTQFKLLNKVTKINDEVLDILTQDSDDIKGLLP